MMGPQVLRVEYVSNCKQRRGNDRSAVCWIDGGWAAIIPEQVLREWFSAPSQPDEAPTLYAVLGLKESVAGTDLRKAYRRLARQWHPDVSKEPGTAEQFIRIQHAYEMLSNPAARARYDAGLKLQASVHESSHRQSPFDLGAIEHFGYRSPLRCGLIMADGQQQGRWFIVNELLAWEDITRADGATLVTSWPMGADSFETRWI